RERRRPAASVPYRALFRSPDGEVREPVLAGALRVAEALGGMLSTWQRSPLQVLARLHVLAAADLIENPDRLGRPRQDEAVARRRSEEHTSELQSRENLVCR